MISTVSPTPHSFCSSWAMNFAVFRTYFLYRLVFDDPVHPDHYRLVHLVGGHNAGLSRHDAPWLASDILDLLNSYPHARSAISFWRRRIVITRARSFLTSRTLLRILQLPRGHLQS